MSVCRYDDVRKNMSCNRLSQSTLYVRLRLCLHLFRSGSVFIFKFKFHNKLHKINKDFRLGGIRYTGYGNAITAHSTRPEISYPCRDHDHDQVKVACSLHTAWPRGGDNRPALSWSSSLSSFFSLCLYLSLTLHVARTSPVSSSESETWLGC